MHVTVDLSRCQGYGNCVGVAPEVFDLDDSGQVVLLEPAPSGPHEQGALQAEKLCPVQAIKVERDAA